MKKLILLPVSSLLLVACQSTPQTKSLDARTQAGPPPTNYQREILQYVKSNFFDPYSIKSSEISKPVLHNVSFRGSFWIVCVRANAKNRMGGYVGIQTNAYLFRNETLFESAPYPDLFCDGANYAPFSALENIK